MKYKIKELLKEFNEEEAKECLEKVKMQIEKKKATCG